MITTERPVDRAREQVAAAAESLTAAMETAGWDQVVRLHRAGAALALAASQLEGLTGTAQSRT